MYETEVLQSGSEFICLLTKLHYSTFTRFDSDSPSGGPRFTVKFI